MELIIISFLVLLFGGILNLLVKEEHKLKIISLFTFLGSSLAIIPALSVLASGQEIMEALSFTPTFVHNSLLHITITDTQGNSQELYLPIHCSTGKEAQ